MYLLQQFRNNLDVDKLKEAWNKLPPQSELTAHWVEWVKADPFFKTLMLTPYHGVFIDEQDHAPHC